MTKSLNYICYLIPLVFIITLFITHRSKKENFASKNQCPDLLIKKDKYLVLYNTRLAKIPGVNPVKFNNLEDYVEYVKWQQSQGLSCPVLFLQHSYDAQGYSVYKKHTSPLENEGGLPPISGLSMSQQTTNKTLLMDAGRNDPPYNTKSYPGFDPMNQYIGLDTPLDEINHTDINGKSPNPMDTNWGGHEFTKKLIDEGYYEEENVKIYIPG